MVSSKFTFSPAVMLCSQKLDPEVLLVRAEMKYLNLLSCSDRFCMHAGHRGEGDQLAMGPGHMDF